MKHPNIVEFEVTGAYGDESETPLFAWNGYSEANTAVRGNNK